MGSERDGRQAQGSAGFAPDLHRAQGQPYAVGVKIVCSLSVLLCPRLEQGVIVGQWVARQAPDALAIWHERWQALASQVVQGRNKRVRRGCGGSQVAPDCSRERHYSVQNRLGGPGASADASSGTAHSGCW